MGILSDLTLEQLRNATLTQIQTAIKNKLASLTKKQLIILILKVADIDIENYEIQDNETRKDGPNGQISTLRIFKEALGNKTRSEKIDWTYYPSGQVDTITIIQLNASDIEVSRKTIKHFLDGRQPREV